MPHLAARVIVGMFVIGVLILSGLNFGVYFANKKPQRSVDMEVTMTYWKEIIARHPTYGVAYRELAQEQEANGYIELAEKSETRAQVLGLNEEK